MYVRIKVFTNILFSFNTNENRKERIDRNSLFLPGKLLFVLQTPGHSSLFMQLFQQSSDGTHYLPLFMRLHLYKVCCIHSTGPWGFVSILTSLIGLNSWRGEKFASYLLISFVWLSFWPEVHQWMGTILLKMNSSSHITYTSSKALENWNMLAGMWSLLPGALPHWERDVGTRDPVFLDIFPMPETRLNESRACTIFTHIIWRCTQKFSRWFSPQLVRFL